MIYVTGDLHGDLNRFKEKPMKQLKPGDTLLVCGDFGVYLGWQQAGKSRLKISQQVEI